MIVMKKEKFENLIKIACKKYYKTDKKLKEKESETKRILIKKQYHLQKFYNSNNLFTNCLLE